MNYDSDSSAGDDAPYTETNTLLGYASKDLTDDAISQLGGVPTWIDDKTAPSGALAKCKVCNDFMCLLLQLNGDLPEKFPGHERRLYVFSCKRKTCRRKEGSIRTVRASRTSKTPTREKKTEPVSPPESKPAVDFGAALFGPTAGSNTAANPFSNNSRSTPSNPFSTASNPFANVSSLAAKPPQKPQTSLSETFAAKARISESSHPVAPPRPHEPWPDQSRFPPPYPQYYLDADYEALSAPSTPQAAQATTSMDLGEGSGGSGGAEDKELFESSMDKTFQKFADRMGQNPEQVMRYEFGGSPVLYSNTDAVGKLLGGNSPKSGSKITTANVDGSRIPRCTSCGSARVFEVQLTPHAITVLEEDEMGIDGMDWGTIVVGVCSKDCSLQGTAERQVEYVEEWAGVQWEELGEKR